MNLLRILERHRSKMNEKFRGVKVDFNYYQFFMFEQYIERHTLARKEDMPVHISEILKKRFEELKTKEK